MKISLVTPAGAGSRSGNRATAERWARFLRQEGHEVLVEVAWGGEVSDLMIALHTRRSRHSIKRYAAAHPDHPLIVVLTGTDLYRDIRVDEGARESLGLATRVVVLQEAGLAELEPHHRAKARVIYQSAEPIRPQPRAKTFFDVCVVGNLRAEKDPFRCALAARLLPPASRVRITHVGKAHSEEFADRAAALASSEPRYRWLGEVPRWRVRRLLSRVHLLVQSSIMEGGANAVAEALAAGVPVIASRIAGNVGMLGEDYPGYYPVGDESALALLLERTETDVAFHELLEARCAARRPLTLPERERGALGGLVEEVAGGFPNGRAQATGEGVILAPWTKRRA
ncbi:TIGR04348 family glycosyltransferase [Rubrobacter tropicus]|uniref:TIGR04348 family glycosyltransferase n=2 Tax=Rubrobacter tropicus TaxID=2653851 RepID=A0A6G8QAR5_9ACTN|nr:TIGR04348 family glycosyltransferase [Rubrobacter tropicus]